MRQAIIWTNDCFVFSLVDIDNKTKAEPDDRYSLLEYMQINFTATIDYTYM